MHDQDTFPRAIGGRRRSDPDAWAETRLMEPEHQDHGHDAGNLAPTRALAQIDEPLCNTKPVVAFLLGALFGVSLALATVGVMTLPIY